MKTEQETQVSIEFSTLNLIGSKENYFKCIQGNEAYEYCTNQNCCQQKIFQCDSRKCKCRQNHKSCLKADLSYTFQKINSKINDTTEIKSKIQTSFDLLIDQLSQIRDKMIDQIDQKLKYHGLHEIEKLFLKSANQEQQTKLTSKQTANLWNAINGKLAPKYSIFEQITKQINRFQELLSIKSQLLESSIKKMFKKQELIQASKGVENLKIEDALKVYSSIVTEDVQIQRLKQFFSKKLSKAKLLLKASDHDYDIGRYFDLYGNQTDVMLICKTQKDKIIGGYTPLSFNPDPHEQGFVADFSRQSFIFSLSENDKFELKEDKKAIYRDFTKTILTFGNAEFEICDKANEVKKSCTYLTNQSYSNPNYTESPESFMKLNGNQHEEFFVQEWEVWKVNFQAQSV